MKVISFQFYVEFPYTKIYLSVMELNSVET